MTLDKWLNDHPEISDKDFARRIGVSRVTLFRLKTRRRMPGQIVMERIHTETGGDVAPNDFFNIGETSAISASSVSDTAA